ncbi:hypothetical protein L1F06_004860 [Ectopseudomonas hydrolytica]|uniref:Lipoprotein n=1 Tax=Ectopseudomonas hydrolytica TaxID=2493633 RepID=A0ABY5AA85_9GAMM|nr:hypothetical protein [Pseudomonas hydrolytica]USR40778.1 hypothetical protein L1F06_004860 [Pseudomonas hydrolytica]
MKPIERAALIAGIAGLVAGCGLAWLFEGASVWFYVLGGAALAGGIFAAASKDIEAKQAAKSE